ncbi:MAG: exosortase/archaeosortase family protein [Bryobacteraceae bacterium]|jgi:exosortase
MWDLEQTRMNGTFRTWSVLGILLLTTILFWLPLKAVLSLSFQDDRYLPIAVAPFMCLFLLYWERRVIFPQARFSPRAGLPLLSVAMLLGLVLRHWQPPANEGAGLIPVMCAVILVWMAAFFLCYGPRSFKKALFALCCLLLMIPVPAAWMDRITVGMEHGSAATSYVLLRLMGIPVFRQDMTLSLPGLNILVAPECSGIRSWLAFVLGAILATRVYLRSGWGISALIVMTVPIAIFKNAIRIVLLASLTVYVNRGIIDSPLHHQGGPVFALIDIAIFVPLLALFQRLEPRVLGRKKHASDGVAFAPVP